MKNKKFISIVLSCILLVTSLPFSVYAEELTVIENDYSNAEYAESEIVITTSNELIDASAFTTYSADECTLIDFEEEEITEIEELNVESDNSDEKTYVIKVEGDVLEKCEELAKIPGVECAEPNLIFQTYSFSMPTEISSSSLYQSHMKWYFDKMEIPEAWQEFESTGEGVVVAVIDNGFKLDAFDFPQNLWTDKNGNHGWNTYKNSADISPIYKSNGASFNSTYHGTHVAGIIGATPYNGNIIGAAYNAELMLINAAYYENDNTEPQFYLDDLLEAVDYAIDNGADVINMSLGAATTSSSLENIINKAYNAGIAIIAAAGNAGKSTTVAKNIPASYENVIGVMAGDKTDSTQLANFSNYDPSGQYYDVVAPGTQILSCCEFTDKVAYGSGTSQASPLVAACAAMYLSEYPEATVADLYDAIRNSPTTQIKSNPEIVNNTTYYFDFLNAYELLSYGKIVPEIILNNDTFVTKDLTNNYIYGLDENFTDIFHYLSVKDGTGSAKFIPTENGVGTGSILNIYDIYGDLYETYRIIIFGDLNGDAVADGQDAVITSCVIYSPDDFEDYLYFAGDVDFDNLLTEFDYYITADYAIGKDVVFQTR